MKAIKRAFVETLALRRERRNLPARLLACLFVSRVRLLVACE